MSERPVGAPARTVAARPSAVATGVTDAVALVLFVAAGLGSHRIGAIAEIAMRNLVPLGVAWVATSAAIGTYRRRDLSSLSATWAIAVPIALLVRTWWVGSPVGGRIAVFLVVGLAFTGLFLLAGRGVLALVTRTRLAWRSSP